MSECSRRPSKEPCGLRLGSIYDACLNQGRVPTPNIIKHETPPSLVQETRDAGARGRTANLATAPEKRRQTPFLFRGSSVGGTLAGNSGCRLQNLTSILTGKLTGF